MIISQLDSPVGGAPRPGLRAKRPAFDVSTELTTIAWVLLPAAFGRGARTSKSCAGRRQLDRLSRHRSMDDVDAELDIEQEMEAEMQAAEQPPPPQSPPQPQFPPRSARSGAAKGRIRDDSDDDEGSARAVAGGGEFELTDDEDEEDLRRYEEDEDEDRLAGAGGGGRGRRRVSPEDDLGFRGDGGGLFFLEDVASGCDNCSSTSADSSGESGRSRRQLRPAGRPHIHGKGKTARPSSRLATAACRSPDEHG